MRLTVIICTHDPSPEYFDKVISGLRRQTLPKEEWKLILVDNASDYPLANRGDISWHPNGRYVLEPELGLAYARQRGIKESQTAVVVFVDDDNILDSNYLIEVVKISGEWPHLGTWGAGIIAPEYEVQPSPAVQHLLGCLALRNDQVYPYTPKMPWGAGLCIRTNVAHVYSRMIENSEIIIVGRRGTGFMACDDKEMTYLSRELCFDTAVWPAPGSEDTELGVLMEPEVGHGEAEVYTRVQA